MNQQEIGALVATQKAFFANGVTRPYQFRRIMLDMLSSAIHSYEDRIFAALAQDLGKPIAESYVSELAVVYEEIRYFKRHLRGWSRKRRVRTPFVQAISSSHIEASPFGVSLIIAPWNYPFALSMAPLLASVAAGNTIILKPSEHAPVTATVLAAMINEFFTPDYITVVDGGAETSQWLIDARPDHIFYTGSTRVGRIIMKAAAEHLIPVVLELGGKSPCVVLEDADLEVAAHRIVWGKFLNCGQTCVAPDYLLVHQSIKDELVSRMIRVIGEFYAPNAPDKEKLLAIRSSPDYGRIINDAHFKRLVSPLSDNALLFGGDVDASTRYISPTLIDDPAWDSPYMQEEIFGPILPVITFDDIETVIKNLQNRPSPLAFYLFTSNRHSAKEIMRHVKFGGGCVNDTIMHLANPRLPFGGVGESGMGSYHGKAGFDVFTYSKSTINHWTGLDLALRYPPYADKLKIFKRFMH